MRNVFRLATNDLRLMFKDRTSWIWLVVMPIALIWFFGQLGAGPSGAPQISLTVDDRDGGWLARELLAELRTDQVALTDLASQPPGERLAARTRTLVIPAGFTEGVLRGEQQEVRLEAEPGSSQDFGFAAQVHALRAIGRLLARLAEVRMALVAPADEVSGTSLGGASTGGNEVSGTSASTSASEVGGTPAAALVGPADEVSGTLASGTLASGTLASGAATAEAFRALAGREKLVTLAVSTAGRGRAVPSGRAQSVPGMLTMMVLMMTLIYGAVFLAVERREGMLRRQASMPLSRFQLLSGKILGRFLVAATQAAILVTAGRFLFGIRFGDSPLALALLLAATCFAAAGLATLLGALVSTPEQAESVGWIAGIVLASLGGCWWSSELMPRWLQKAAHVLPSAWAMDGFHALISFGRGLDGVWLPATVLFGFGLLTALLGARFLRFD